MSTANPNPKPHKFAIGKPAAVSKIVKFPCGCIAEYQFIGGYAHIPEWHVTPCHPHAENRPEVEQAAEAAWVSCKLNAAIAATDPVID